MNFDAINLYYKCDLQGSPPKPWERSGAEGASGPAPSGGSTREMLLKLLVPLNPVKMSLPM
jgi:hypothetical protein